jgi:hypothetical protein
MEADGELQTDVDSAPQIDIQAFLFLTVDG